jgi:hypothetical protein
MFYSAIENASANASDRVLERIIAGLQFEFGRDAAEGLAKHFIDAEDADFAWEARHAQRWLGCYESLDDEEELLDRMAVMGRLGGRYYVAVVIVDEGDRAQAMLGKREFATQVKALEAYAAAR